MRERNLLIFVLVIAALSAIIGLILSSLAVPPPGQPMPPPPEDPNLTIMFIRIKTMIAFVNMALSIPLLVIYGQLYRQLQSKFTVGLIIMILVLFLYAVTSNPLLHVLFGFHVQGLGLFTIIPDLFATLALMALLYISLE
ncbi:MAG: hypothetical protein ACTSYL_10375 [Candidatus Thorarchaeota archaeon]